MRYILYLFTLALVFTLGMLVGNFYLPVHSESMAVAVSVPDVRRANPAIDEATPEQAQRNLRILTEALASCPVVVEAEKEHLFNQLSLFLTLQDFTVKKYAYEVEIAKNTANSRTTAQFSRAAAEYSAAKSNTERLADQLFPPQETTEPAPAQTESPLATDTAAAN